MVNNQSQLDGKYVFLILSTLAWLIYGLSRAMFSPLFPVFRTDFGLSYVELGFIITSFNVPYAAMQLPSGILANRYGEKIVMTIGLALSSFGTFLIGFAGDYFQLTVYLFILGIAEGTLFAPSMALLSEYFPKATRGRAVSIYGVGRAIGAIAAPLLVGLAVPLTGWRFVFMAFAPLMFALFFLFLWLIKDPIRTELSSNPAIPEEPASEKMMDRIKKTIAVITIPIVLLTLINVITAFGLQVRNFLPSYLVDDFGMDLTTANLLYTILPFMGMVSMLTAGYLSDRFGRRPIMFISLLVNIVSMVAIGLASTLSDLIVIFMVYGFIGSMSGIVLYAFFGDITTPKNRSTAYGFMNLVGMLSNAIAPLFGGWIIDVMGFRPSFIILPLAISTWGLLIIWIVKESK